MDDRKFFELKQWLWQQDFSGWQKRTLYLDFKARCLGARCRDHNGNELSREQILQEKYNVEFEYKPVEKKEVNGK